MTDTFAGGGYVTPPSLPVETITPGGDGPNTPTAAIPAQRKPEPDPFVVIGMQCAVQMFEPLDATRLYQQHEYDNWWHNITMYADGVTEFLRSRSAGARG